MTPKDKELLLKDLCARLPYHTRVKVWLKDGTTEEGALDLEHNYGDVLRDAFYYNKIVKIKPYLFPLSSMPEGYWGDFYCKFVENEITYNDFKTYYFDSGSWDKVLTTICDCGDVIDWFNKYHFDYRGLIEKRLAIDATGLNIYN